MKEKKKTGLARLFEIAGERKGLLILAGALSAASAACMLVPYWSVYEILNELLHNGGDWNRVDGALLIRWGWIAFFGLIGGLILLYGALMSSHVAAFRILYGLRASLSRHIGRLPLGYLNGTSTGAIKKTMEQNIEKIENFIAHTIPDMVNVVATIALMFAIFFSLDGWLAAVCLAAIAVSIVLQFSNFMGKKAQEFTRIYFDAQERMSASAVQYVRGMPVVKIFGQSVRSFRQFNAEIEAYKTYALKVCDTYQSGMIAFVVILNSLITFILPVGLLLTGDAANIALAAVWLFFIVMGPGVASPVYKLMYLGGGTREINEGVVRIDRIFEQRPIPEATNPQRPESYDIEFRNVSFSYENKKEATRTEALRDLTFTARQGEITALVGPSGSGKSTVANLIPRFWDVRQGEIRIGGINIKEIATEYLMDIVSFVFQDTFLFYDTLYENIAVGRPDAKREEVEAAARAAQCHDFIERLPNSYMTRIGDKGVYLSGGEAQRICVARAILKNAPILVLDEATAFADPENEYKMQQALQALIRNKTVIIIAHRLSSIISAGQIVVLKEGRLVQCGRHGELSTTDGVYKKMWDAYTDAFRWQLNTKKA
ncbi:MAG: ABC transporter ATP-binding protein/permease [Alistipes sp.]|uniref:ABC transporter ATP-binding protein n=1 Tax=Alistipes sp. TaxID=1872444 RepID=UPI0025B7E700|nr:ABC transporter ATP-binding protein [Alistipes sp.]MCD8276291.1 ABC transporter ATP-binding protein/permease [Alistipes sp.]